MDAARRKYSWATPFMPFASNLMGGGMKGDWASLELAETSHEAPAVGREFTGSE
jgi:hypothetical protein